MTHTFIKDEELIEESYQVDDLLDFSSIINDFKERINKIKKNSIVGLIGPYGSGKSTMLYQIYKDKININKDEISNNQTSGSEHNQQKEQWFIFDAWQYPERKDLWEGFVLDIARQCDEKTFKKTENRIDGNTGKSKQALANTLIDITSTVLLLASLFKNLTPLFQTSPIKRVYEFQDLLLNIINQIDKDIFIVIEDIDRSGDMGIFFLETLKHFIKNLKKDPNRKVIVIVPIGNDTFYKYHSTRDSYLKILDYQVPFNPSLLNFTNFIEHTIDIDIAVKNFNNEKDESYKEIKEKEMLDMAMAKNAMGKNEFGIQDPDISSFEIKRESIYTDEELQKIFMEHIRYLFETMILNERQGTIRDIKSILRKVNAGFNELNGEQQKLIDIRILMLFTTIGHFYRGEKDDPCSFYGHGYSSGSESKILSINDTFWGKDFFLMIMQHKLNIDEIKPKNFIIDTVNKEHIMIDIPIDIHEGRPPYYIMDAYFKVTKAHINYLPKGSKL